MFTGIIECTGCVEALIQDGQNIHFKISSSISSELKIDQSVSHNGVCLTVTDVQNSMHNVTAVMETLNRSNMRYLSVGSNINLERCVKVNSFLDGHIVQGHVDTTATCTELEDRDGSYEYTFKINNPEPHLIIDKGSIAINGVSLTVINPLAHTFKVAIIPYTWAHTTFKSLSIGAEVNIEYDVIGKYVARYMAFKS